MRSQLVTGTIDCPTCHQTAVLTVQEFWAFGVGITRRSVNFYECPSGCKPPPAQLLRAPRTG